MKTRKITSANREAWDYSYFNKEPFIETDGIDYYGGTTCKSKPTYSFTQTMAETIMAGINNGLDVEHFEELPSHNANSWWNVEKQDPELPMSYTLVLRKKL